jgi:hypothetical protein
MTAETIANKKIVEHIRYGNGIKTVCVSTCLNYFGIAPDRYRYTTSHRNMTAYHNVLRKAGYSVRSRITEFRVKKYHTTMTALKAEIKRSKYGKNDMFIVSGVQTKSAHLMIVNGDGNIVIDTAPKKKWKIRSVYQVVRN